MVIALQESPKLLAWVDSNTAEPFDKVTCNECPLEEVLGMKGKQSTLLLVRPRVFKFGILAKGMVNKLLDISVNDLLGDVVHFLMHEV